MISGVQFVQELSNLSNVLGERDHFEIPFLFHKVEFLISEIKWKDTFAYIVKQSPRDSC